MLGISPQQRAERLVQVTDPLHVDQQSGAAHRLEGEGGPQDNPGQTHPSSRGIEPAILVSRSQLDHLTAGEQ